MSEGSGTARADSLPSQPCCGSLVETGRSLMPPVVTIDGPAGSGKSTIGHRVAQALNYLYFDTGAMYRAVTWMAIARGVAVDDEVAVGTLAATLDIDILPPDGEGGGRGSIVLVDGQEITGQIRRPEVDRHVSVVSAYAQVRDAMSRQQRRIGQRYAGGRAEKAGVVMVGRDIGTVIMPDAAVKIFLDASLEQRAQRRFRELEASGKPLPFEQVMDNLVRRDAIDSGRALSPLRAAEDAVVLDTSAMTVDQVIAVVLRLVEQVVCAQGGGEDGAA